MSVSRRVYRALLVAFPAEFRREFGDDMADLFSRRLRDEGDTAGARARLWTEAVGDVVVQAAREWGRTGLVATDAALREGMTMEGWIQDLRIAGRGLRRRPGFTVAAAGTLALGIGAVVALFSVVHGVLLSPLPYPESERIVIVGTANVERGDRDVTVDHPDLAIWREAAPGFQVVGVSTSGPTLTGLGDPVVIDAARVTGGILSVFGLSPAAGRDLTEGDDVPDGPRAALISHDFWETRLGRAEDALGRTLELNGSTWEIVGVAPRGFDYPDGADVWMARRHDPDECGHGCNIMRGVGRLPPGATIESVEASLRPADQALARDFPDSHRDVVVSLESMREAMVGDVRSALWVLMAAVSMVLLIACANVANLTAVRAAGRAPELAVRSALGAGRNRLTRQLLAEALLLSALAAGLGLALAGWGVGVLSAMAPDQLPRMDEVGLDGLAVIFTVGLAVVVTALFGVLPARRATAATVGTTLREDGRGGGSRRARRSRSVLLAGEVALSLTLLLGAGLLFRTLQEMRAVDLGFDPVRVERFRVSAPEARYDTEAAMDFLARFADRLEAIPGVTDVGYGFGVPFASGSITTSVEFPDRPPVAAADRPSGGLRTGSPGYLDAMGLQLVSGRWFTDADEHGAPAVAVLNQAAARAYASGEDPLGLALSLPISWGYAQEPRWTVVGVVADVRSRSLTEPDPPTIWVPNAQLGVESVYFAIRRAPGMAPVMDQARRILAELDPNLAPASVEPVADAVARQGADTQFYLALLTLFSGVALLLAGVGLYGVVAYAVGQRTREIGIRRALGARASDVVGMVVREGVGPALAGVGLGLLAAWFGSGVLSSLLYGIEPYDPLTLVAVTALLLAVVGIATWIPARRASAVAPADALRDD